MGDGPAYFEEASHALRHLLQKRSDIGYETQDYGVQEFFGRSGETLGRYLTIGTDMEYLFSGKPARDMNDPELRQRLAKELRTSRKTISEIGKLDKMLVTGRKFLREKIGENYAAVQSLVAELQIGAISLQEYRTRFDYLMNCHTDNLRQFDANPDFRISDLDMLTVRSYNGLLEWISFYDIDKLQVDEQQGAIANSLDYVRRLYKPGRFSFDSVDVLPIALGVISEIDILKLGEHLKPYKYAQQYSAPQLLAVRDLYALPDHEVRQRFFKKINE